MMDKEQFLASGLLEQYALGLTSPEETRLVEHFIENYPDIRLKMNSLQDAIEQYVSQYAVPPPRQLKERILSEIEDEEEDFDLELEEDNPVANPVNEAYPAKPPRAKISKNAYIGFISVIFIALILIVVLLWQQRRLRTDYNALSGELNNYRLQNKTLQDKQTLSQKIFDFIENGDTYVIHLRGTGVAADAHAVIYWNPITQKSYAKLVKMPALPSGKQFQLWAEVDGKMVSAGVLDNARKDLQAIDYVANAHSLNITIEPLGGSKEPSVLLLIAKGQI